MTTVQITFRFQGEFRPEAAGRTQEYHSDFGIRRMEVDAGNQLITVEYDATRLDEAGVAAVLRRCGVPVTERMVRG
jgi:hypothetical protein